MNFQVHSRKRRWHKRRSQNQEFVPAEFVRRLHWGKRFARRDIKTLVIKSCAGEEYEKGGKEWSIIDAPPNDRRLRTENRGGESKLERGGEEEGRGWDASTRRLFAKYWLRWKLDHQLIVSYYKRVHPNVQRRLQTLRTGAVSKAGATASHIRARTIVQKTRNHLQMRVFRSLFYLLLLMDGHLNFKWVTQTDIEMKYVKPSQIMLIKKGQLDDEWGEGSTAASTVRQGGSSRQATPRTDPPTILFLAMWCPCLPPPSQRLLHIVVFEATLPLQSLHFWV